jgi:hypothetical protein
LRSQSNGAWVIRDGAGYRAFADGLARAEPFRMQATDLGRHLFYGPTKTFLSAGGGRRSPPPTSRATRLIGE